MKPLVFLDSTALNGRKPFTRPDSVLMLELSRTGRIRLVVPEVVLHELARQWRKRLTDDESAVASALGNLNTTLEDAGLTTHEGLMAAKADRSVFYEGAAKLLASHGVEVAPCPDVPTVEMLERDIAARKPFTDKGKGFRDALIWESIRRVCQDLNPSIPALFVTNNHTDFCDPEDAARLHGDLHSELPTGVSVEVVPFPKDLLAHTTIRPLAELLRAVTDAFTLEKVGNLVKAAVQELEGSVPEPKPDSFSDDDDRYVGPFRTLLHDAAFNWIRLDMETLGFEVYNTGDAGEMTLRAVVQADCELEGFIDRSALASGAYSYYEDWSHHTMRVLERPRRAEFSLNATFTADSISDVVLDVDEIEEVTLLTPLTRGQ